MNIFSEEKANRVTSLRKMDSGIKEIDTDTKNNKDEKHQKQQ